ncbi:hypothetical protein ACWGK1_09870 [Streptomyces wedmorensis]
MLGTSAEEPTIPPSMGLGPVRKAAPYEGAVGGGGAGLAATTLIAAGLALRSLVPVIGGGGPERR